MRKNLTERLEDGETEIAEINKYISQLIEAYSLHKRFDSNVLEKIHVAFAKYYYHVSGANESWKKHCNGRAENFLTIISAVDDSPAFAIIDWIYRYPPKIKFFKFKQSEDNKIIELLKNYDSHYKIYYGGDGRSDEKGKSEMLQTILDMLSLECYQTWRNRKGLYRFLNNKNTIECIVEYAKYGRKILSDAIDILENVYFWLSKKDFGGIAKKLQEIDKGINENNVPDIKNLIDKMRKIRDHVGRKIEEKEEQEKEKSKPYLGK